MFGMIETPAHLPMKVRDLIERLAEMDPDALVVVSGEAHRPPEGVVEPGVYCPDTDPLCNPVGHGSFRTDAAELSARYFEDLIVPAVCIR